MPRGGKGGNKKSHKGQRRHFTNEDDLQRQAEKKAKEREWRRKQGIASDESGSEEEEAEVQPGARVKVGDLPPAVSSDEETDSEEEEKHKGVEHLIEIQNPNRAPVKQARKVTELSADDSKPQLTRREREEIEKQQARANYRKLHEAGKTDEARADLARLALIRKQREDAAKKKEEERLSREKAQKIAEDKLREKRKGAK